MSKISASAYLGTFGRICGLAMTIVFIAQPASATDLYWDSNGTTLGAGSTPTGTWGTSNFWNTDSTGGATGAFQIATTSTDTAHFSAGTDSTGATVTVSGANAIQGIIIEEGAMSFSGTATPSLTIGANGLTINSNGNTSVNASAVVTIGADQNWANNGTGTLTIGGGVVLTNKLTLTSGLVAFNTGANTGTGGVRINGAAVTSTQAGAFGGATGSLQLSAGSLRAGTGADLTVATPYAIDGSFTFLVSTSSSRHLIFTGGGTISNAPTITLSDASGSGTQFTTGAITLNSNVTFDGAGLGLISSAIGESGTRGLTYAGTGTLTLRGANTFTGTTAVNRGTLLVDLSTNTTGVLSSSSNLALGGGAINVQGSSTGASSQTLGNVTINAGGSAITLTPNGGSGTTLTLGNTWTRDPGGTLVISFAAAGTKTLASSPTLTNGILGYAIVTDATTTARFATVSGGNIVGFIPSATLAASSNDATATFTSGNTGVTHDAGDWSANALEFTNTTNATLSLGGGVLTLTTGAVLWTGAGGGTRTISNGQVGASGSEVIFHQRVTTQALTVSGTISGGAGRLTKAGGGNLTLTGANSYTGDTLINSGTLQIGAGGTIGSLNASSNVINNAALILSRSDTFSFTNVISGTGTLTKSGSGTTTLGSSNAFTGKTTVTAGVLSVSSLNSVVGGSATSNLGAPTTVANGTISLGTGTATTANTLLYTGSGETTDRVIAPAGGSGASSTVDASGSGALVFTSAADFGGFSGGGNHNFILTGSSTALNTFNRIENQQGIASASTTSLTKRGVGTWVVQGATNDYASATVVSEGTLIAGGNAINKINRLTSVTADASANTFTLASGALANGDTFVYSAGGTPAGITSGNTYFVVNASGGGTVFQLATSSGGAAIDFSSAGTSPIATQLGVLGANSALTMGDAATGTSNANVALLTGGAFTIHKTITVNNQGNGTYTIGGNTDNTSSFGGTISLNRDLNISQVATTASNALEIAAAISAGSAGTKTVTFTGPGAMNVGTGGLADGSGVLAVAVSGGTTAFNIASTYTGGTQVTGGTLAANNGSGSATGTGAVTLTNAAALQGTGSISGLTSLNGTNTLSSTATLTLSGGLSVTGTGTISTGTIASIVNIGGTGSLAVNGTLSGAATVAGTLSGNGTVSGNVTLNGTLAPGASEGKLTIGGTLDLNGLAALEVEGTTRGVDTGYDAIDATTVDYTSGTLTLSFQNVAAFANGTTFDLFAFSGQTGDLAAVNVAGFYGGAGTALVNNGGVWSGDFGDQTLSFTQNNGDLSIVTSVPEPTSLALIALGGMAMLRRRRRQVI